MWSIALLINTSTWSEFKEKWKLFCIVFLQLYAANGVTHKDNKDILLQKIRDIKSDPNTVDAIKLTEPIRDVNGTITSNIYSYQSGDEEENDGDELNNWPSRLTKPKKIIDEERESNSTDSPFKTEINKIYHDALIFVGISSQKQADNTRKGILNLFKYLTNYFMPTLPIWSNLLLEESRLKPIEERWRQSSCKRGHGHYTKNPDEPLFANLVSSLLACKNDVNCDLKLPTLLPDWLNTVVGLILSTRNNIRHLDNLSSSLFCNSKLINVISTFVDKWTSGTASDGDLANITSTLSTQELPESSERSAYILEQILIPLLPCHLLVNKIYSCKYCDSKVKMQMTITSIPVNTTKTGLNLEHLIYSFFLPTQSDFLCSLCNKPTIRNIEVVQWPPVLIININDIQTHAKFLKPTYVISLNHFSNWLAIGSPSAFIYDLICFNSLIQSGTSTTMTFMDRNSLPTDIFKLQIKLTDSNGIKSSYKPVALLLLSRYNDSIAVIKPEGNKFIQYTGDTYSKTVPISYLKMIDLFNISGSILCFHRQVNLAALMTNIL
ncbi:unnamed protein product [Rotaria sp. Silwood2]|nr:unnamed protein product [Rotaria sp. Silwood2]